MPLQRITHSGAAPPTNLLSSITATALSFGLTSSTGYPTGSGGPFVIDIDSGQPTEEKVLCSSLSGGTITVAPGGRGWDGTVAVAHTPGTALAPNVTHIFSSSEADDANAHIYDTTRHDHGQYVLQQGAPAVIASTPQLSIGTTVTSLVAITDPPNGPGLFIVHGYLYTVVGVTVSLWASSKDDRGSTTFYFSGKLSSSGAPVTLNNQAVAAADSISCFPMSIRMSSVALGIFGQASVAAAVIANVAIEQVSWS